jgi:hypothetical protein
LPKGGGAIQSIGKGWGAVGVSGSASFGIALPITAGRGYAPALALGYQSTAGNGLFGMGWALNLGCVARRASKGVPTYTDDDVILGPGGDVWLPERGIDGTLVFETVSKYLELELGETYQVIRYFARVEGAFDRIEHWRIDPVDPGFWLIHGADGSLAFYGKKPGSRSSDPADSNHVAEWLLEETMNVLGEHILYEYKAEDEVALPEDSPRDYSAQCYLWRVRYGNKEQSPDLYLWKPDQLENLNWHFDLLLDYGERVSDPAQIPAYADEHPWPVRSDPHSSFAYGFELGNLRLCQQALMFHHFPEEGLGAEPRLINRLLLKYQTLGLGYNMLQEAHLQAFAQDPLYPERDLGQLRPPVVFESGEFAVNTGGFHEFDAMPGLNDGQRYQLVDLYGDGLPGVLYQQDKGWYYREPLRDEIAGKPDATKYGPCQLLPSMPTADARTPVRQSLSDLTGDGKLDWIVAQPGMAGFFTLNHDRSWSEFATFGAFPPEFFNPLGQLADLIGGGLSDLALIGPRSVRLYANKRAAGFAPAVDVAHDEDNLPLLSNSPNELVAFSDILGTGQQHLIRIRHDGIWFWPNLGAGRFGVGKLFAALPFRYEAFDAGRIRLADMDGSGAADLLYLEPDHFSIFMNRGGNGLDAPYAQNWPEGVRYDRFCQVSMADLQGLGCSSLVLTTPHMKPRHWRFDYSERKAPLTPYLKPYLLQHSTNNMGAVDEVFYRSSAQEWLDEKNELLARGRVPVPELPFPVQVVVKQTQLDEITENLLTQRFQYRKGFYDGHEREFRGFGLLIQTDTEVPDEDNASSEGYTAPVQTRTWFHTGRYPQRETDDYNASDPDAQVLGAHLLTQYDGSTDSIITEPDEATAREMARSLAGSVLHAEVFGLEGDVAQSVPYSVQSSRYLVRQLAPLSAFQPYARMLPLALESIGYRYEGQIDDPHCDRSVSLAWDEYGALLHGASVNCARRKQSGDEPPFEDSYQNTWWRASHDDAQQTFYFQEARSESIHLDLPQGWRLGLPYRQRSNAMLASTAAFSVEDIGYEQFIDPAGKFNNLERTLTALSLQRYVGCEGKAATFVALPDAVELAELDDHALSAYDRVMTPEKLIERLVELKYEQMPSFLPDDGLNLWSVRRGFNTYAPASAFYHVTQFRPTSSHGLSTVEYDAYWLLVTSMTDPTGCKTTAEYEYRTLQPIRIVDPNQNTQEAAYDAFGQVSFTSFFGTELGVEVGFDPIGTLSYPMTPNAAVASAPMTLGRLATYSCYDAFSWMDESSAHQPVHSATLVADRYPDDPERQIRISMVSYDGFGRVLQTRQRVEDGDAYKVDPNTGNLEVANSKSEVDPVAGKEKEVKVGPIIVPASPRWRVSERVEYNNKGLPIRIYRPYFANEHRYVNDQSIRDYGYCDKQHYDPLGRPTVTYTAADFMRRQTYLTWYSISEDENDTHEEMLAIRAARSARQAGFSGTD